MQCSGTHFLIPCSSLPAPLEPVSCYFGPYFLVGFVPVVTPMPPQRLRDYLFCGSDLSPSINPLILVDQGFTQREVGGVSSLWSTGVSYKAQGTEERPACRSLTGLEILDRSHAA